MFELLRTLCKSQTGATAVEYGLICSLIVIAAIGAISAMSDTTNGMWNEVSDEVVDATN